MSEYQSDLKSVDSGAPATYATHGQPATPDRPPPLALGVIATAVTICTEGLRVVLWALLAVFEEITDHTTQPRSPDLLIREAVRVARAALKGEYAEHLPQVQRDTWHGANQTLVKSHLLRAGAWLVQATSQLQAGLEEVARAHMGQAVGAMGRAVTASDNPEILEKRALALFEATLKKSPKLPPLPHSAADDDDEYEAEILDRLRDERKADEWKAVQP